MRASLYSALSQATRSRSDLIRSRASQADNAGFAVAIGHLLDTPADDFGALVDALVAATAADAGSDSASGSGHHNHVVEAVADPGEVEVQALSTTLRGVGSAWVFDHHI